MDPYIGEIRCFGFNFAPLNWAFCNGQLLAISQNAALFAILGTVYGGDGRTTFALPNLQGRSPMHWGDSPSGLNTRIGEDLGQTTVTLTTNEIPSHIHTLRSAVEPTDVTSERLASPTDTSYLSSSQPPDFVYQTDRESPDTAFSPKAITQAGGSQPHENMQPYLTLNFCIALTGIFPSRN